MPRLPALIALLLLAGLSTWWVLLLTRADEPPALVGPPRSDYSLSRFEMVALDKDGQESFVATGPLLTRHPYLGTLDIDEPRFQMPDGKGGVWTASARDAWVQSDASQLRLLGDVRVRGPGPEASAPELRSELIDVFPRERRLESDEAVTVTGPGSILRGVGMRADLETRFVELLSEVQARYEPPKP